MILINTILCKAQTDAFDEITILGIKIKRDAANQMPVNMLNTIEYDSNIDIESGDF